MPRPLFWAKRRKQPSAGSNKEFANEEGKVRQRTVRRFLSWRGDRSGILVHPWRIEGFADRNNGHSDEPMRDRGTVFSDQLFRCHDSVLSLRRIEHTALSAVVTQFQPVN
jgi:hypothetical protein